LQAQKALQAFCSGKLMTQHNKELKALKEAAYHFLPSGAFIAGGALTSVFTNTPVNDVDIYFKTEKDFILAVGQAYDEGLWCVAASDRAVTFVKDNHVIQLMHFDFFETGQDIFDVFDFTVAMAAYDIDKEEFVFHEDFLKHASQRFLRFHSGTRYPYGSLLRVLKYQQRGYTIGKGDLLRIGLSLQKVPLSSWEDLATAIGGQYGEKALIETDRPFSMDAAIELFKESDFIADKQAEEMPGNAYDLLEKINVNLDGLNESDIDFLRGWSY
jgi:hypothetical protein